MVPNDTNIKNSIPSIADTVMAIMGVENLSIYDNFFGNSSSLPMANNTLEVPSIPVSVTPAVAVIPPIEIKIVK